MVAGGNVGVAFALVFAAGLSTTLGASCAFFAKLAEPIYLAAGLGVSAGVMLYVSFVEIFMQKGVTALTNVWGDPAGYRYGTLLFFGGMLITLALDRVVHVISSCIPEPEDPVFVVDAAAPAALGGTTHIDAIPAPSPGGDIALAMPPAPTRRLAHWCDDGASEGSGTSATRGAAPLALAAGAARAQPHWCDDGGLSSDKTASDKTASDKAGIQPALSLTVSEADDLECGLPARATDGPLKLERKGPEAQPSSTAVPIVETLEEKAVHLANVPDGMPPEAAAMIDTYMSNDHHRYALKRMGVLTAVAIGVHNLPEGLATFVAALSDPLNGVAIAVAIALHNIPEGVCVAMPVYYATGSRWKGFFWAFLSGLSEPLGGLLGWLVLAGNTSDLSYGILFTVVGGMMTYISVKELIPTALKYDPHDRVVSTCVIGGMVAMAVSLLMFTI